MKKSLKITVASVLSGLPLAAALAMATPAGATAHCTPTGFIRDGINLTAAQIGGNVSGTLNATGCDIGVYYNAQHQGNVNSANIYGATYFGVAVDGGSGNVKVDVSSSSVHNIGDVPFSGDQHGNAIYYYGYNTSGSVSGSVNDNHVSQYQKGGIIVNGAKANVSVNNNTVTGLGRVDFIAQNGIQFGYGANGTINNNTVSNNDYTGDNDASSGGILLYGGGGDPVTANVTVQNNTLTNNDVGIFAVNYNADFTGASPTPTRDVLQNNIISDNAVTNVSGNGYPTGYQAGIEDVGNRDTIQNNTISGKGYAPENNTTAFVAPIDVTSFPTIHPNLQNNTPSN